MRLQLLLYMNYEDGYRGKYLENRNYSSSTHKKIDLTLYYDHVKLPQAQSISRTTTVRK
jgi:hypothetical protein